EEYDTISGSIYATAGTLNISGQEILPSTLIIADENLDKVYVTSTDSYINLTDGEISNFNLGVLTIPTETETILSLAIDLNIIEEQADTITVGAGSSGTILITSLTGMASSDIDATYTLKVLNRTDSANEDGTYDINLALSDELKEETKYTVDRYLDESVPEYIVYDDYFFGTTGVDLNETFDSIIFGITENIDALSAVNTFEDTEIARSFHFRKASSTVSSTHKLGVTGAGTFIVYGYDDTKESTIDLNGYTGFDVENETNLTINDVTITYSKLALLSNNENAITNLNNLTFEENTVAILNESGVINLNTVLIETGTEDYENTVINNAEMNIINSTLNSQLTNSGILNSYDISEDDSSGENNFANIINTGSANFTSSKDIITLLTNNGEVITGETTVITTTANQNGGTISTSGQTSFDMIENYGEVNTTGTNEFATINNNEYGVITLGGTNTVTILYNNSGAILNTADSTSENDENVNTFTYIENTGELNFNSSSDTIEEIVNNGAITAANTTTFKTFSSEGTDENSKATVTTDGTTIFDDIVYNNSYSEMTLGGNNTFNYELINAKNAVLTTTTGTNSSVENRSQFIQITNAGTINLQNTSDTVETLINTGTVMTADTTVFETIENQSSGTITTSGTTTFNGITNAGTITLGGTTTLNNYISGNGSLIISGTSTLNTTIYKDMAVTIQGSGTLNISDTALLYLNTGDSWSGVIRMDSTNSTMYYNNLTSNGRIIATYGNLYIESGTFAVSLGASIAENVYTNIAKGVTVNVGGGTLNLGSGDNWLGTINLTSGTMNLNNLDSNSTLITTGGSLNISNSEVEIDDTSSIGADTRLNLNSSGTISLTGGTVNVNTSDTLDGTINAQSGTLILSDRNSTNSTALYYSKLVIDDENISNVDVYISNTEIDLTDDSTYETLNLGNLIISDNSDNNVASSLKIDCDVENDLVDSIAVGSNSSGVLTISEFNTGTYTISRSETKEFTILYRTASGNGSYNTDFTIVLSDAILAKNNTWTVETYKNLDDNTYTVEDTNFIGTIGYGIYDYDEYVTVKIGALEEFDTLYSVNIYSNDELERIYVITEAKTVTENLDLGETGSGKFTLKGATSTALDSIIDMNGYSAFDLENVTTLTINNLTVQNASTALLSNNNDAISTLNNVILSGNIIAIENNYGTVTLNSSTVSAGDDIYTNIIKNNAVLNISASTISSDIVNTAELNVSGITELNYIYNSGEITLNGTTTLKDDIDGDGTLIIKGLTTLYSNISDDTIVSLLASRELYITGGTLTLDENDSWAGKIILESDSSVLTIKNIETNGTLTGTSGALNTIASILTISSGSSIADDVIFSLDENSSLIISGGSISINDGDLFAGAITLTSGTLNYSDLTQNGQTITTGGTLNIESGTLSIAENSTIHTDTILTIFENAELLLADGNVTIDNNDTISGQITASSGTLNITNTTLTDGMLYIADENNSSVYTNISGSTIDLTSDNLTIADTNLGMVTIDNIVYLKLDINNENGEYEHDTINVSTSSGTIIISELNGLQPKDIANAGSIELIIINNSGSSNLKLDLTDEIKEYYRNIYTVETYLNEETNTYELTDSDLIGQTGIDINNDKNGIIIGVVLNIDTLYAVNISDLTPRIFTFSSAKTIEETMDLGETGSGIFTFNGYSETASESILDMDGYAAFNLVNETAFYANNLTIQNASIALALDNENAEANLNNVILTQNEIAIQNTGGTVNLTDATVSSAGENLDNKVINGGVMNIINSAIGADLENSGTLTTNNRSEEDTTSKNTFANITNSGSINFNSISDTINYLENSAAVSTLNTTIFNEVVNTGTDENSTASITTNGTTTFNGSVSNNEYGIITTNGETTFTDTIKNAGALNLNDTTTFNTLENSGTAEFYGTTTADKITNYSTLTADGKTTVDEIINTGTINSTGTLTVGNFNNQGDTIADATVNITTLTNTGTFSSDGANAINSIDNSGTIALSGTTEIKTLENQGTISSNGTNTINDITNTGKDSDNIAAITLTGTNTINGTVTNDEYSIMNVSGSTEFSDTVENSGDINSTGNVSFDTELTNSTTGNITISNGTDEYTTYDTVINTLTNAGKIDISTDTNTISTTNNTGTITIAGSTSFNGTVTNTANADLSVYDTTEFNDTVYNTGTINTSGITVFNGDVTNTSEDEETAGSIITTGSTVFNGTVTNTANTALSVYNTTNFNDTVYNKGTINTSGTTNFNDIENNGTITISGTTNLYGDITGGGILNIYDNVNVENGSISGDLEVDLTENAKLTLAEGTIIFNLNDTISGNITAISGELSITDNYITQSNLTIADENNENVELIITNTTLSTADDIIQNMNLGSLTSSGDSIYNIDLTLLSDTEGEADTITVASGSTGTITICDLNGLIKDEITHNATAEIKVLNRADSANADGSYDINLALSAEIISKYTQVYAVTSYYDEYTGIYDVKDTDFIGTTGITLNSTLDSIIVGILSQDDTLHAVNIATDTPRSFTMTGSEYIAGCNLETTGAGIITINGQTDNAEESVINMNKYSGFILANASQLTIQNITITNALADNGSVLSIESISSSLVISNVIFDSNTAELNGGVIYTQGSSVINSIQADFQNNTAKGSGGAIYTQGNAIITSIVSNFYNNTANSGGAIYLYSDGTTSTYISTLDGEFEYNSASEYGGAIANYTAGSKESTTYSTITKLTGTFTGNYVSSNTSLSVYGGAIYNTGRIYTLNAEFNSNYIENTLTGSISSGGAIYNTGIIDTLNSTFENNYVIADTAFGGAIYNTGTISTISSSFTGNYVEGTTALGGAIYTTSNLTFLADDETYTISGNYTNNSGVISNQGIYIDGTNITMTINVENDGVYTIEDNIDGSSNYMLYLTSNTSGTINLTGEINNATAILNGAVITVGVNTFADTNTTLTANTGIVKLKDNTVTEYVFNSIYSTGDVRYSIDLILDTDDDGSISVTSDKINVGENSQGSITLYDIGLNILSSEIISTLKDELSSINVIILTKENSDSDIYIELDESIVNNPIDYTIDETYNYYVTDTDFIGSIGFSINENRDGINIGVTDIKDTLVALNQYAGNPGGERSFNFTSDADVYTVTEDLGITGAGTVYINIYGKTIEFDGYSGFEVVSDDAVYLYINDATLTNSKAAIVMDTTNENSTVTLSNVTFTNNITAISNTNGTIYLDNVTVDYGYNTQINGVM
ncbi:MAG: hypothetical protein LUB59_04590, partial [Candidatus Gastranaerophilales bacterium]|nr:hypothetical protein [Candidatus Gastranaerophilales bacterium]